jgi:hypothetical protein
MTSSTGEMMTLRPSKVAELRVRRESTHVVVQPLVMCRNVERHGCSLGGGVRRQPCALANGSQCGCAGGAPDPLCVVAPDCVGPSVARCGGGGRRGGGRVGRTGGV